MALSVYVKGDAMKIENLKVISSRNLIKLEIILNYHNGHFTITTHLTNISNAIILLNTTDI